MSNIIAELELLYSHTKKDPLLKSKLLATQSADDKLDAFCKTACDAGHLITIGELLELGEEYSDNQCKSTNGGNPYPYDLFDDPYESFMASLEIE